MEVFDVCDRNGVPLGYTRERGTVLSDGEFYIGAHVYIHNSQGQFLMQRRTPDKNFRPGCWEILLEHAIAGENSRETAARGVREELGLFYPPACFHPVYHCVWPRYHHIMDVFFLQADIDLADIILQTEEAAEVRWFSREEMLAFLDRTEYRPRDYLDAVRQYIHEHIL